MSSWNIKEYINNKEESPYRSWLKKLDKKIQARIQARVQRFKNGNFGDHKVVGENIWEARFFFGPGFRLYFSKVDGQIVLLLAGGDKSDQTKTVKLAESFLKDFIEENKNG